MAAVEGQLLPVGLRSAIVYELSATGRPKATNTTAYEGLRWTGPKAFSLTIPKPRAIQHYGADRVLKTDALPPTEAATGQLSVSDYRFDIQAVLTGNKIITLGEAKEMGWASDNQGFEPQVGLLLYQQAVDLASGARRYHCYIIPKALCLPAAPSMSDKTEDVTYEIFPQVVTQRLWGATLVEGTEGYTTAQLFEYETTTPPNVVSWIGDGNALEFNFPAAYQCAGATKAIVSINGVVSSANLTVSASKLTYSEGNAPANAAEIVCFYEVAA